MNKDAVNTRISPTAVVTIYSDQAKRRYYLEHSQVKNVRGKPTLLAPTPMSEDVFRNLAAAFVKNQQAPLRFEGLLQEHILYGQSDLGRSVVAWYRPAGTRLLNFSTGLNSGITGTLPVPATLYLAIDGSLFIFALADDKRPELSTKLYRAPFYNIYADGRVCLGTARVGKRTDTFEGEAERFERAFYLAEQNGGNNATACKTPLNTLWPKLAKAGGPFPSKAELVLHSTRTLGDLLRTYIKKKP